MNILVSACLLGVSCRYDGKHNFCPELGRIAEEHTLIPVCPESYGGLPVPRDPAEIREDRVIMKSGKDVTAEFQRGAGCMMQLADFFSCEMAILKECSPSCGSGKIYDGTFSKTLTDGEGIFARLVREAGIRIIGESEIPVVFPTEE